MDYFLPCSRQRKVIEALIISVHGFNDLHECVVAERARAEAEQVGREPVVAGVFFPWNKRTLFQFHSRFEFQAATAENS